MNGEACDVLSFVCIKSSSHVLAKQFVQKFSSLIRAQQFEVSVHMVIGAKVIAKERIIALRRDVIGQKILAHGHSGDPLRKKKLPDRRKEGKKKLREISNVEVPAEAFVETMKL